MGNPTVRSRFDEAAVDALFAELNQVEQPGVAVAIAIAGEPVYRKGFGLANMELPIPLSTSMRMRIGSTTKHFTCLAFLLLCEAGLASLDDPIGRFVPGLHEVTRHRTIRELMGHTSGIRDILALTMHLHGTGHRITDAEMIEHYRTIDTIDNEPGVTWSYNNGGYILLTAAIEAITGDMLANVLAERIFKPAGMFDTMLRPWDTDFIPNSATLHMKNRHGNWTRDYMGMEISGMGGVVSTMDDMLLWMKNLDQPVMGTPETWRTLKEPHQLRSGRSTGYGLGLFSGSYRGTDILYHSGSVMGGNSQMIKVPQAGLDISIASNRADVMSVALANQVIDACVEGPAPRSPAKLGAHRSGIYISKTSGRVLDLIVEGEEQTVSVNGGAALPYIADGEGVLQLPDHLSFLQQWLKADGDSVQFSTFGHVDELSRVTPPETFEAGAITGTYRCEAADVTFEISASEGKPVTLMSRGRHGSAEFRLVAVTPTVWRAENLGPFKALGAVLTFTEDGTTLIVNLDRVNRLKFSRCQ